MPMNCYEKIKDIKTKNDFLSFMDLLQKDFMLNKTEWQNQTIDSYFESISSWVEDVQDNTFSDIDLSKTEWKTLAQLLYVGKIYE